MDTTPTASTSVTMRMTNIPLNGTNLDRSKVMQINYEPLN